MSPQPTLTNHRPKTIEGLTCYHCHQPCPDDNLRVEDKHFCCEGCKTVYEILSSNNLCAFYQIDPEAGRTQAETGDAHGYAWLDDPDVRRQLLQFSNGQTARVSFYLPSIHCASCIWLLEHLYRLDPGVLQSRVDFLKKEVSIVFDEQRTTLRQLAVMLARVGYPPDIRLGDVSAREERPAIDRSLLYKIGVAGFAFGNIMLLSFPEYLGLEQERDAWFFSVFGYINLVLAVPVLLYSGRDYFVSAYEGLRQRYLNIDLPLALGMAVLFGRSAWEILTGTGAGYMDSLAGLVFFLLIGRWFQQKTYHRLSFERDYRAYFPVAASRCRADGSEVPVPIQKLEPGDIIRVRNGELIPADGVLLEGRAQIDYSFVTGEAEPVSIPAGEVVYAGGRQMGEAIEICLTRRVDTSYLTQLWNDEAFQKGSKGHASQLAERAGRYFTALILGVASLAFLYWAPQSMSTAINAFTAVLIIACPCAVALSIPFTMGNVLRLLARHRFFVKNTQVLEAFSTTTAVIFDKTGTITTGAAQTALFFPADGQSPLSAQEASVVRSLAAQSNHPASRQIAASLPEARVLPVSSFVEITGQGTRGEVNGTEVRLGSSMFILGKKQPAAGVFVEIDGIVRGHFEAQSRYRNGLREVIHFFKKQNTTTWLLSGDNERAAAELAPLFDSPARLRFHQSPHDKLAFVQQLQQQGQRVLMIGDGLNDAGALQRSNVGIAVAENTNTFTPACDAILDAQQFERLPQFLTLARWGIQTVNRAYVLAACYNAVGLSFAVSGTLSPVIAAILMPLSSVTVVLFGFGMTHWKAHRLGL